MFDAVPTCSFRAAWTALREERDGTSDGTAVVEWPSDYWIAHGQDAHFGLLVPTWRMPEELDRWPVFDMSAALARSELVGRATAAAALEAVLDRAASTPSADRNAEALHRFHELHERALAGDGSAALITSHVRVWLTTVFGELLKGVVLAPAVTDDDRAELIGATVSRIGVVDATDTERFPRAFLDFGCDEFYDLRPTENGVEFGPGPTRQGQGSEWQQYWDWLGHPAEAAEVLAGLDLVGGLLLNESLLHGLALNLQEGAPDARMRSLCVVRRWALTTRALAWLSEALHRPWRTVRPQDLAHVAFASLAPTWPRRAVALSHRSADVKPTLCSTSLWWSPDVAVDARSVPAWETNSGMIWGLFASAPVVVRVGSPTYLDSEWCARESELIDHLVEHGDFLEGRAVVDVDVADLHRLEALLPARPGLGEDAFPPLTFALEGRVDSEFGLAVLRAGGAMRLLHLLARDPATTNDLAGLVAAGIPLDLEPPTDNVDGWEGYRRVLCDLDGLLADGAAGPRFADALRGRDAERLPLAVPPDYQGRDVDLLLASRIPTMRSGDPALGDLLAAFEFRRTLAAWYSGMDLGDKVLVDVTSFDDEAWASGPEAALGRGLLSMSGLGPTWVLQDAGQGAHGWRGFRDQPIFTRHVAGQLDWMKTVLAQPTWLLHYLADSGLATGPDLQTAVLLHVARSLGRDALDIDDEGRLTVPRPDEFFVVRTADLSDLSEFFGEGLDGSR